MHANVSNCKDWSHGVEEWHFNIWYGCHNKATKTKATTTKITMTKTTRRKTIMTKTTTAKTSTTNTTTAKMPTTKPYFFLTFKKVECSPVFRLLSPGILKVESNFIQRLYKFLTKKNYQCVFLQQKFQFP